MSSWYIREQNDCARAGTGIVVLGLALACLAGMEFVFLMTIETRNRQLKRRLRELESENARLKEQLREVEELISSG